MKDGMMVRAEVHFTWRVIDVMNFVFSSEDQSFRYVITTLSSRFREFMEKYTLGEATLLRREACEYLIQHLQPTLNKRGIEIEAITVGALEQQ